MQTNNLLLKKVYDATADQQANKKLAKKITIINNKVIDNYVLNYYNYKTVSTGASSLEGTLNELYLINKPKVDKEYAQILKSKLTSDSLMYEVTIKRQSQLKTIEISTQQYEQIKRNVESVTKTLREYDVQIDKYKKLTEKAPLTQSRKGILTESISNINYIRSQGINIMPHVDGYHEMGALVEHQHRQVKNDTDFAQAQEENAQAVLNGEDPPNPYKTWIWTGEGKTTRHESNNKQTVPIDDPFIIENDSDGQIDEMMFPLDPNVTSSNGWICYCEVEYHNDPSKYEN